MDRVITRITAMQHLSIPFFFGLRLTSNRASHKEVKRYMPIFNKIAVLEKCQETSLFHHEIYSANAQPKHSFTCMRGKTLEINVVPNKICPGDCLYCPNKATLRKTVERESFYPIDQVINAAVSRFIHQEPIERILLTGYGDPALNKDLSGLFNRFAEVTSLPIAVKSCGTLLWRESVRHDLMKADAVHINIDAADKHMFGVVNKLHLQIPFVRYMDGIDKFRRYFPGEFIVHVHLLDGINTGDAHLERLSVLLRQLKPFKVIVHALSAPGGDGHRTDVGTCSLHRFMSRLVPIAEIDRDDQLSPAWQGKHYAK